MSLYSYTFRILILGMLFSCENTVTEYSLSEEGVNRSDVKVKVERASNDKYVWFAAAPSNQIISGTCTTSRECLADKDDLVSAKKVGSTDTRTVYQLFISDDLRDESVISIRSGNNSELRAITFGDIKPKEEDEDEKIDNLGPDEALKLVVDSFTEESLEKDLKDFASDDRNGRLSGTAENDEAAEMLAEILEKNGYEPGTKDGYLQQFRVNKLNGVETNNIIGIMRSEDETYKDEYIVIGAHMDHAGTLDKGYTCSHKSGASNEICNGADDNGSGSMTLKAIAEALPKLKKHLKMSVIVMWFSGEEEGLVGSNYFVRNPVVKLDRIHHMINLDMVGYMKQNRGTLQAIGATNGSYAAKFLSDLNKKYDGTKIKTGGDASGGSDHAPFMGKGIKATFFHTGVSSNPNYHKITDTADKIDYKGMKLVTQITMEHLFDLSRNVKDVPNDDDSMGLYSTRPERKSLLSPEELAKSCHHLIPSAFPELNLDFANMTNY